MNKIVVDIDGTLCESSDGSDYGNVKPITAVINMVNKCYDAGYYVTIFTARGMNRFNSDKLACEYHFAEITKVWLAQHTVKYNELIFGKPSADFYIDDKGIRPDEFLRQLL